MQKNKRWLLFITGLLMFGGSAYSQTISTYSGSGIGDIVTPVFTNQFGSGSIGISKGETWYINQMNPALLPYNVFTVFQAGIGFETKAVKQNGATDHYSSMSLLYFSTAMPAKAGKWSINMGIQPYSRVSYNYQSQVDVPGSGGFINTTQDGTGGFNQAYLANGFRLRKNLTIGIKAGYIFSSIIKESNVAIGDPLSSSLTTHSIYQRTTASDIIFSGGIAYKHKLNSKVMVNYGATYDPETKLRVKRLERLDLRTPANVVIDTDTLFNDQKGYITVPQKIGFGVSFSKGQRWTVGTDFDYRTWSGYKNYEGNNENFSDGFSIRVGGEITPEVTSIDKYFKRMTYRMGVTYDRLPYKFNNKEINDFGINFGWSFPVSRISSLDFGLRYGIRGSTKNNLVKENYFQIKLGFTYNDRWFIRRVYD